MKRTAIALILIVTISLLVVSLVIILRIHRVRRHFPIVDTYQFDVTNHNPKENFEQFKTDLDLVKDIGFEGVKLWNVESYLYYDILDDATREIEDRGLVFVIPFLFGTFRYPHIERNQFPENHTMIEDFKKYVTAVTNTVKDRDNLLCYMLYYPFNWTIEGAFREKFKNPAYAEELQGIIDTMNEKDGDHPIYLVLDFPPSYEPPYGLEGIAGFGVNPYSLQKDEINRTMIDNYVSYFGDMEEQVLIAEWGVRTLPAFEGNPPTYHGLATTEENKCQMIKDFVDHIYERDIIWCYFGLHDHPEEADWGLANLDNTLKLSGLTMKQILANNHEDSFLPSCWMLGKPVH